MSYISNGQGYTYGIKTLANAPASGMSIGDTFFCTDNNRVMTYDGAFWVCDDFVIMVNRIGRTLLQWELVVVQSSGTTSEINCTVTSIQQSESVVGVVVYAAANNSNCVVAIKGKYKVLVSAATAIAAPLTTSTIPGRAITRSSNAQGIFGFATTSTLGSGTVDCIIMPRKELN
jgi:hypothetical protein